MACKYSLILLRFAVLSFITTSSLSSCTTDSKLSIRQPPSSLKLDPFYQHYLDADGIPITSSSHTPIAALFAAQSIVHQMLEHRPDILAALVAMGARISIMAQDEGTVDLPEQRDWKKPTRDSVALTFCERKHYDERIGALSDRQYWNSRARGMGGLMTSGAAENILAVPNTKYYGENIFVHEFSHEIMEGIRKADPALEQRVKDAFAAAKSKSMWKGEYIETTFEEYWAEGTQFWFNSNKLAVVNGRRILSDRDLKAYDPTLFTLLSEVYGHRHHLRGDAFYKHPASVPPGPPPVSTAEVC